MLWCFLGVFFAGGGWKQWSVVGGQWSVEAADFFRGQISKNARFIGFGCSVLDGCWWGFLLMLGKLGVEGKDFLLNGFENFHVFWVGACTGSDRLLVGDFEGKFRAKARRRKGFLLDA
jgi:hypothetical protein